ncbi:hypothetical protein B9W73_12595 [Lactococcus lactis]|uniref:hypothetical protein n=1 Tax=Lactococcus lactis TaxID=1358 RepID=UPI000A1FC8A2|nr:hypothetical protein [Lactococcus lactis]OSP86019.1 hypothetical protein B9W73_12595 [Lactococcus lactis]
MLNSSKDTIKKMAWLNKKKNMQSLTHLQVQKFLYFYEMFQKASGKEYDFDSLKAYANGPVFGKVYGDIAYREPEVLEAIDKVEDIEIDEKSAEEALFTINSMTDTELSSLTHLFDMWNSKSDRINAGEHHIPIRESDITERDIDLVKTIIPSYPIDNPNYHTIVIQNKRFIVSEQDFKNLTDIHYGTLELLSNEEELINPVYLSIEEDGGLLVD